MDIALCGSTVSIDMRQVELIEWKVTELVGRLVPSPLPGFYYWNVRALYGDSYFILESGVMPSKVEALTRARGRARFFRSEKARAR